MARNHPVTGPFPDGDSRNITLTRSDNAIEPERTGPIEQDHRDEDVPGMPLAELPTHNLHASPVQTSQTRRVPGEAGPQSSEIGLGGVSGAVARATLGMGGDQSPIRAHADAARTLGAKRGED